MAALVVLTQSWQQPNHTEQRVKRRLLESGTQLGQR